MRGSLRAEFDEVTNLATEKQDACHLLISTNYQLDGTNTFNSLLKGIHQYVWQL